MKGQCYGEPTVVCDALKCGFQSIFNHLLIYVLCMDGDTLVGCVRCNCGIQISVRVQVCSLIKPHHVYATDAHRYRCYQRLLVFLLVFLVFFFFLYLRTNVFACCPQKGKQLLLCQHRTNSLFIIIFSPRLLLYAHILFFILLLLFFFFLAFFAREMCALAIFSCINCGWPNLLFLHRRFLV